MCSDLRLTQLNEWIKDVLGSIIYSLTPISGDASFRRYFRFRAEHKQYIAVDAPPEKENNEAFVKVTHLLAAAGLPVPHIYYSSLDFGFFLIGDFGDVVLLNDLDYENVNTLYGKALDALAVVQQTPATSLPDCDKELLSTEMGLFREWFLNKHLAIKLTSSEYDLLEQVFASLVDNALAQPQVFVHGDYHSRNLMQIGAAYPGIIDYQDAVCGPVTYDLVSLLRDCYIEWPSAWVEAWALSFRDQISSKNIIGDVDEDTFLKWFDLMGLQRHLKAIGIFSRLHIRDDKSNYLADIPRTLRYIQTVAPKYPDTCELARFADARVLV